MQSSHQLKWRLLLVFKWRLWDLTRFNKPYSIASYCVSPLIWVFPLLYWNFLPVFQLVANVLLLAAMVRSLGHVGGLPCMLTTQHTGLILGWDRHPKCLSHMSPICTLGWQFPHPLLFQYPRIFNFSPHPNWVNYLYCSSLVQVPEIPKSTCARQSWNSRLLTNPSPSPFDR